MPRISVATTRRSVIGPGPRLELFEAVLCIVTVICSFARSRKDSLCLCLEAQIYALMENRGSGFWRCLQCHLVMKTKTKMFFHVEAIHLPSSTGYHCPDCGKFCSTLKALSIHKYRFHKEK